MVIDRLSRLKDIMKSAGCDALLITAIENIRYVTGFTGSSAVFFFAGERGILFADSRYAEQAGKDVRGFEVRGYKKKVEELSAAIIGGGYERVGFEDSNLTCRAFQEFKRRLKGVRLVPLKEGIDLLRAVKSQEELRLISRAAGIAHNAFERLLPSIAAGRREDDLAIELEYLMRKGGAEAPSFDLIVASGVRSAMPHGRAGNKALRTGDPVVIDFGARYRGYHSDETVTLFIGKASERHKRIYRTVKDAHDRAIEAVKPGSNLSDIDRSVRAFIDNAGYGGYFGHGTGHGVGLNVHEYPSINPVSRGVAEEGMVFTIEPGIYIPDVGGVRIEDMVLVTKGGCRVMTKTSKELRII